MEKIIKKISKNTILILSTCIIMVLFFQSMFGSSYLDAGEKIYFVRDSLWWNLVIILVVLAILVVLKIKKHTIFVMPSRKTLKIITGIYVLGMIAFVLALQVVPRVDQYWVLEYAGSLTSGDYKQWQMGGYLFNYPNQNGIVLFFSLIVMIFGKNNWLVVQFLNILALLICAVFISKIIYFLFKDEKLGRYTYLLTLAFFPINAYVTFVYGTLLGMAAAITGIYFVLKFCQSRSFRHALSGAALIAFSCGLKNNYLIFLVAAVLIVLYDVITKKNLMSLLTIIYIISIYILLSGVINTTIKNITDIPVSQGIPNKAWVAMGLQEGSRAPGWYNDYNKNIYKENQYNTEQANREIDKNIRERLKVFSKDNEYALNFFARKTASQWNDGTFNCFWINNIRTRNIEWSKITKTIMCDGGMINKIISDLCNAFLSFLWLGVLLFILFDRDKMDVYKLVGVIVFIGGFLFHLFWEAKGQYTLVYVYLLIPYMIRGYQMFLRKCKTILADDWRKNSRNLVKCKSICILMAVFVVMIICGMTNFKIVNNTVRFSDEAQSYENYLEQKWNVEYKGK